MCVECESIHTQQALQDLILSKNNPSCTLLILALSMQVCTKAQKSKHVHPIPFQRHDSG